MPGARSEIAAVPGSGAQCSNSGHSSKLEILARPQDSLEAAVRNKAAHMRVQETAPG